MKKSIRYSSVIAAALLAVSPVLSSNVASAAETKTEVKSDTKKDTATTPATKNDKKTETAKAGDSIDNPIKLTSKADMSNVEVEYKDGMKVSDIINNLHKKSHIYAGDKEITQYGTIYTMRDKDDKPLLKELSAGDKVVTHAVVSSGLEPNTWYQWTQSDAPYVQNADKMAGRYEIKKLSDGKYQVSVKTDDKGNLETFYRDKTDPKKLNVVGIEYNTSPISATLVEPSTTVDTSTTTDDTTSSTTTDTTPATDTKTEDTKADETKKEDTKQDSATTEKTDTKEDTPATTTDSTSKTATTTVSTTKAKSTKLMLKHNSYVYTKAGKATKKNGKRVLLKKNKFIVALDKAKTYTIKHKKFYRIGKNQYVKVANTTARPKIKTIKKTAVVKANKNTKVRLYNADGQLTKKTVKGQKSIKLDRQQTMNGKKCYRIKGTNNWILASKVTLKK